MNKVLQSRWPLVGGLPAALTVTNGGAVADGHNIGRAAGETSTKSSIQSAAGFGENTQFVEGVFKLTALTADANVDLVFGLMDDPEIPTEGAYFSVSSAGELLLNIEGATAGDVLAVSTGITLVTGVWYYFKIDLASGVITQQPGASVGTLAKFYFGSSEIREYKHASTAFNFAGADLTVFGMSVNKTTGSGEIEVTVAELAADHKLA